MSALPTRILWLLRDKGPQSPEQIMQHFAAFRPLSVRIAINRLMLQGLITHPTPDHTLTENGTRVASLSVPPRWSVRQHRPHPSPRPVSA